MDRLETMAMFVRVVESGSFSSVAKDLKTTQPTVSKHVADLENWLGAKLLNRSTRKLALTEVGKEYYQRSVKILQDIEEAEDAAASLQTRPRGILKVSTVTAFGSLHLVPHLDEFFKLYPDISLELSINERLVDLVQDDIDIAIRVGALPDSSLMAKKLANCPQVTVATPAYCEEHGIPTHPNDLKNHNCLIYTGRPGVHSWPYLQDGDLTNFNVSGKLMTNNSTAYRDSILQGIGIGNVPKWLVCNELISGELLPLLENYPIPPRPINAVYLSGLHIPLKISCFLDFISKKMAVFSCDAD